MLPLVGTPKLFSFGYFLASKTFFRRVTWFSACEIFPVSFLDLKEKIFPKLSSFEPSHEIMVLFVLRKLILQTRICSHPVGLDVWILVGPFVFFYTSCVWTAKALTWLHRCAGSPEPLLFTYVITAIISWAGAFCDKLTSWPTAFFLVLLEPVSPTTALAFPS